MEVREETNRRLVDYPGMHEMKIYWPQYLPHRVEALSKHLLAGFSEQIFLSGGCSKGHTSMVLPILVYLPLDFQISNQCNQK